MRVIKDSTDILSKNITLLLFINIGVVNSNVRIKRSLNVKYNISVWIVHFIFVYFCFKVYNYILINQFVKYLLRPLIDFYALHPSDCLHNFIDFECRYMSQYNDVIAIDTEEYCRIIHNGGNR